MSGCRFISLTLNKDLTSLGNLFTGESQLDYGRIRSSSSKISFPLIRLTDQ
jgi:hypothetical protein